jgi:protein farnesyltransferase subunit beta
VLSGLSSAQHQWELDEPEETAASEGAADAVWAVLPYLDGVQIFDNKDRVRPIHPVYAIPQQNVRAMKEYFQQKQGF